MLLGASFCLRPRRFSPWNAFYNLEEVKGKATDCSISTKYHFAKKAGVPFLIGLLQGAGFKRLNPAQQRIITEGREVVSFAFEFSQPEFNLYCGKVHVAKSSSKLVGHTFEVALTELVGNQ